MNDLSLIGIDTAKSVFQLYGVDQHGKKILTQRLQRDQLLPYVAQLQHCTIAMEACGGAHHLARQFQSLGHTVKLISAKYVKPFVKTNKNDYNGARAIITRLSDKDQSSQSASDSKTRLSQNLRCFS